MPKGHRPRGATPGPRSGAAAERSYPTSKVSGSSQEELPRIKGQGQRPRVPGSDSAGAAERSYPTSEVRGHSGEELPHARGRGGGQERQPHIQGAVAAWVQEDLEELFHIQGQEGPP